MMNNLNEKDYANRLSGAYLFRNALWQLAHRLEEDNTHYHSYAMGTQEWVAMLEGMGNELAHAIDSGNFDTSQLVESIERNIGKKLACQCERCVKEYS